MSNEKAVIESAALFSGVPQYNTFAQMQHLNAVKELTAVSKPFQFAVAKSFVSALVGIALAEGSIGSIEDPINQYGSTTRRIHKRVVCL